jgi:hypothetical protein
MSPLKFQLQRSLDDIGQTAHRYLKRKANESVMTVLDTIAPGQAKELLALITESVKEKEPKVEDSELFRTISNLYTETDNNIVKEQLLSIISESTTKSSLQLNIPTLTKHKIDKSRHMEFSSVVGSKATNKRARMDPVKLDHAIDFFFSPCFHQVVSYGTKDLLLESGESIRVPDVVRTLCHSTLVNMYVNHCDECGFEPLSRSTLYKILDVCAASKRKNLHGLDNITADGYAGFETVDVVLRNLERSGCINSEDQHDLQSKFKSAKEYLKGQFKLNVATQSNCPDHCLTWALSDPNDIHFKSKCEHEHNMMCSSCENLHHIMDEVTNVTFQSADDREEFLEAVRKITNWKAHIVRTVNQD